MSWSDKDKEYLLPAYQRLPITIIRGEGCYLIDELGNRYLDMFAGVGVNQLGYNHPALTNTLIEQSHKIIHSPFHFHNPIAIDYAKTLSGNSNGGKVFFTTSGAEATETVLKMLFKRKTRTQDHRSNIIVLRNSFHGRTLGAIPFTRQPKVLQDYPTNFFNPIEIEPNSIEELQNAVHNYHPLAILMEPVLGSGGIIPLTDEFMIQAKLLSEEINAVLIMDEIQSGMGRTGTLFSYQTSGIKPDAILFGKGAGGGIPLGGVIAGERLSNYFKAGDHGTTWAHPPLATALGNTLMKVLIEQDVMNSTKQSDLLLNGLTDIKDNNPTIVKEIRFKGLMFGITTTLLPEKLKKFQLHLLKKGILIDIVQGNIIRLLPPLIINTRQIEHFLLVFKQSLDEFNQIEHLSLSSNGGHTK